MANETPATAPIAKGVRWWPLALILALELTVLASVWAKPATHRQAQVMTTLGAVLAGFVLVLLWLIAWSRLRWRARLGAALAWLAIIPFTGLLFRFHGFSGDLVPILIPRWKTSAVSAARPATASTGVNGELSGFPQFLGPARDGIIPGPPLARDWTTHPPELLWRVAVGESYAGFVISGRRAIGFEQRGANEAVVCRDLLSGEVIWAHEDAARYENSLGGIGPRATPTIAGARVFALGATGHLRALDLASGRLLWQRDLFANGKAPEWGAAGSPLVVNDLVVVHPGGRGRSLAAYRAENGEPAWAGGDARAGYSSPQLVTLLGEPQILVFNHEAVAGHAPVDGRVLWSYPWTTAAQHVTDPRVIAPNRLIVSTGYGAGADLVELTRGVDSAWETKRLWHSQRLKSKFANLILRAGFIYGLDDGRLTCLEAATGVARWKGERIGHGQLLLADDLLIVTAENGHVLMLAADPGEARELGRFNALPGKMWNPPALSPPFLIVRTEREAACYRLPLAKDSR